MSANRSGTAAVRLARARAAMVAERFDAMLLFSGTNLLYLSGYPQLELTLARPFFLIVPQRAGPVLLVHRARQREAARFSWVSDVRTYHELSAAPVAELAAIFDDLGLRDGRLGTELGHEQRLGIPVTELVRLQEELSPARFDDSAQLLWGLRAIKTPDDVAALRRACQITGAAYADTFARDWSGKTEQDVQRHLSLQMARRGGAAPWVAITSGDGNYDLALGSGSARRLEPGDMVWMDGGCQVDGFWSDFSRAGVVGRLTTEQRDAQQLIQVITREGVEMVRPGRPLAEIAAHCNERVRGLQFPITSDISGLAGRVGHGVGLDVTEPPHVSEADPTVLEAGMVITIEPGFATVYGTFHVEENVLCTDDGYELLTTAPRDLTVMPWGGAATR